MLKAIGLWCIGVGVLLCGCAQSGREGSSSQPYHVTSTPVTSEPQALVPQTALEEIPNLPTLFNLSVLVPQGYETLGRVCAGALNRDTVNVVRVVDSEVCVKLVPSFTEEDRAGEFVKIAGTLDIELFDTDGVKIWGSASFPAVKLRGLDEDDIRRKLMQKMGAQAAAWVNQELQTIVQRKFAVSRVRITLPESYLTAETYFRSLRLMDSSTTAHENLSEITRILVAQKSIVSCRRVAYNMDEQIIDLQVVYVKEACPEGIDTHIQALVANFTKSDAERISDFIDRTCESLCDNFVEIMISAVL